MNVNVVRVVIEQAFVAKIGIEGNGQRRSIGIEFRRPRQQLRMGGSGQNGQQQRENESHKASVFGRSNLFIQLRLAIVCIWGGQKCVIITQSQNLF
jgi:hypothetical protein